MNPRFVVVAALASAIAFTPSASADHDTSAPVVSYTLTGTAGTNGWYRSNVTINWSAADPQGVTSSTCLIAQLISTEGTATYSCTATSHGGTATGQVTLKIDKTPPQVSAAAPGRAPDANGWYNHPVGLSVSGADATSGIASCDQPTYSGPDSGSVAVAASCRDVAGNTASTSVALKYDATVPSVSAAPDRAPDGNGWYRKPLTVSFSGADATSGIESCTQPARYAGPDRADVTIAGTCRDHAGNAAAATLAARYDATAPKLAAVEAKLAKGVARLGWKKPADAVLVRIDRVPGVNGRKKTRVYKGTGQAFVDRTVRTGVRYRYELIATDAAGNVAGTAVTADARTTLYAPVDGAVVRAPVRLAWEPVARARYYNVQLHRNGVKVLSVWPTKPRLELARTWRYLGKNQRLTAGLYRWFVWPALGTRAKPRFGPVLGSSTFRVRAR
jgi:hypothetical protein